MLASKIPTFNNKPVSNVADEHLNIDLNDHRKRRDDSLRLMKLKSAEVWADFAYSVSQSLGDAYWLNYCWFIDGQYARVCSFIERNGLLNDLQCRIMSINAFIKQGKFDEAWNVAVLNVSSTDKESKSLLSSLECAKADILMKRGDVDGAKAHYQKALRLDSGAAEAVVALSELSSTNEIASLLKHVDKEVSFVYSDMIQGKGLGLNGIPSAAKNRFHSMKYEECIQLCRRVLDVDPFHKEMNVLCVDALYGLKKEVELFSLSHQLMNILGKDAIALYAVGCYYLLKRKLDEARRYLRLATQANPTFPNAWIAFGITFSMQSENEQALAAFSTAKRMSKSRVPDLMIGMLYANMRQYELALMSLKLCCVDDQNEYGSHIAFNEVGVILTKLKEYDSAKTHFKKAYELVDTRGIDKSYQEVILSNWGRVELDSGNFEQAKLLLMKAYEISPNKPSNQLNLAIICHLQGQLSTAIELYHRFLASKRDDIFAGQMLSLALNQNLKSFK